MPTTPQDSELTERLHAATATIEGTDPTAAVLRRGHAVVRRHRAVGAAAALSVLAITGVVAPHLSGSADAQPNLGASQQVRVKQVTVTGHLELVGGPAPGTSRPQAGTVSWSGPAHGKVQVGADGGFALHLQPGRYKLTGHSAADATYVCQASEPLHVRPGRPVQMDVYCQMR